MSQAMSDREIEDVLASVRRLVAQEERRHRLPPLVLTPEMRIDAVAPEAAPAGAADGPGAGAGGEGAGGEGAGEAPAEALMPDPSGEELMTGSDDAARRAGTAGETLAAEPTDAAMTDAAAGMVASASAEAAPARPGARLPEPVASGGHLPAAIDEAALQAMVAQIVRDELHGRLGERITLVVRKLVRNEIARALDEERRK